MSARYTLHSYFRSSASTRVRIAMALKGLTYDYAPVNLREGSQYSADYLALNPMGELPSLQVRDAAGATTAVLAQSVAILEYLEEVHPEPPLLPSDAVARARVRQLVEIVNSSIQPIQNLKVMRRLKDAHGATQDDALAWAHYWIDRGFEGLECVLRSTAGRYSFGDTVTLADVLLVPQVYNARRFSVDLDKTPTIKRVAEACEALDAFRAGAAERQPDTPNDLRSTP